MIRWTSLNEKMCFFYECADPLNSLIGDDHKLTPAYLLCLCIQHSASSFPPGSFGKLLLKIVRRIQTIAWVSVCLSLCLSVCLSVSVPVCLSCGTLMSLLKMTACGEKLVSHDRSGE